MKFPTSFSTTAQLQRFVCVSSVALACGLALPAIALEAIQTSAPIVLDGKLDEAAWASAPAADKFIENMPNEKQPARSKTSVRFLYDNAALYVGIRAYDDDTSQMTTPFVRRDKVFGSMDNFVVWIDPTGARKFAQFFRVNVQGNLADGSWSEDTTDESFAPDFDYQAVPARLADGWSAEFKIPWSTLRVPSPAPENLNFIVFRNMQRGTRVRMSNVALGREPACFLCVAESLTGIRNVPSSAGFSFAPYVSVTGQKSDGKKDSEFNAGVDAKWRVSNSWVLDATLLPDFSQLEIDTPQLRGNTRFALSVPEKRPFFLEGDDLYGTPYNLVYTRSITDPRWGVRATGRDVRADATALTVQDRGGGFVVLPNTFFSDFKPQSASQVTLARARVPHALAGTSGSFGALLTDRNYENGERNTVLSVDGVTKPSDATRMRAQAAYSTTSPKVGEGARENGHLLYADARYEPGAIRLVGKYVEISPKFRADAGLIAQNGLRSLEFESVRCLKQEGFFNEFCPGLDALEQRSWSGEVINRNLAPSVFFNGRKSTEINLFAKWLNYQRVREGGALHHVPAFRTYLAFNPANAFSISEINLEVGRGVDVLADIPAKLFSLNGSTSVRPHPRVEVELRGSFLALDDLDSGQRRLRESYLQTVVIGHVSANDTVRLIAQTTQFERNPAAYPAALNIQPRVRDAALSLVYAHRWSLGKELSIGASYTEESVRGGARSHGVEGFVKLAWNYAG